MDTVTWILIGWIAGFGSYVLAIWWWDRAEHAAFKRVCDEHVDIAYKQACDNIHRAQRAGRIGTPLPPS